MQLKHKLSALSFERHPVHMHTHTHTCTALKVGVFACYTWKHKQSWLLAFSLCVAMTLNPLLAPSYSPGLRSSWGTPSCCCCLLLTLFFLFLSLFTIAITWKSYPRSSLFLSASVFECCCWQAFFHLPTLFVPASISLTPSLLGCFWKSRFVDHTEIVHPLLHWSHGIMFSFIEFFLPKPNSPRVKTF